MIKIEKLEPPKMLLSQNLLEMMEKMQAERETYFPYQKTDEITSPSYRYAASPESTAVGVQMQLNQSQALLTNHIKLHKRKYWAAPLVMKVIYFRPLKRKSSRRWQKKWAKRGWKARVPQILIPYCKTVMSRKEYDEIMSRWRDATKKAAEAMTKFTERRMWGGL